MVTITKGKRAEARRLLDLLTALGRENPLRAPAAAIVEEMPLTAVQLNALLWLGKDGPLTMGELARRLGSSERAVTGTVDRLEHAGYARRLCDAKDRRVVRVELTDSGAASARDLDRRIVEKTAAFLAILSEEDSAALFRLLERIREVLARHAETEKAPAKKRR
ncbi:MAG: MarR family winged helix-turn-helix transcriptional regulator [Myxococcales bacterium]